MHEGQSSLSSTRTTRADGSEVWTSMARHSRVRASTRTRTAEGDVRERCATVLSLGPAVQVVLATEPRND
jgi:hypothetical protein